MKPIFHKGDEEIPDEMSSSDYVNYPVAIPVPKSPPTPSKSK